MWKQKLRIEELLSFHKVSPVILDFIVMLQRGIRRGSLVLLLMKDPSPLFVWKFVVAGRLFGKLIHLYRPIIVWKAPSIALIG